MRALLPMLLLSTSLAATAQAPTPPRPSTAGPGVQVLAPMAMPGLDRQRTIRVCLPPSYDKGHKRYPVLYMHDGQNLFDDATSFVGEWGVDEAMDALAREGIELIVVGIDHGNDKRTSELAPWPNPKHGPAQGEQYLAFLVGTVKPYIDRHYRTRRGREHTGIMGSSLAALVSQVALTRHPRVFGRAGLVSPAYWFVAEDLYPYARAHPLPRGTRVYMVAGGREGETMLPRVREMETLLRAQKMDARHLVVRVRPEGQHNEAFWRKEFPDAIRFLFGRR